MIKRLGLYSHHVDTYGSVWESFDSLTDAYVDERRVLYKNCKLSTSSSILRVIYQNGSSGLGQEPRILFVPATSLISGSKMSIRESKLSHTYP